MDLFRGKMYINMTTLVSIAWTFAETWPIFHLSRWRRSVILDLFCAYLDYPRKALLVLVTVQNPQHDLRNPMINQPAKFQRNRAMRVRVIAILLISSKGGLTYPTSSMNPLQEAPTPMSVYKGGISMAFCSMTNRRTDTQRQRTPR